MDEEQRPRIVLDTSVLIAALRSIVTHNLRHLREVAMRFKIEVKTPGEFLNSMKEAE